MLLDTKKKYIFVITLFIVVFIIVGVCIYTLFIDNKCLGIEGDAHEYVYYLIEMETGVKIESMPDDWVIITLNGIRYRNLTIEQRLEYGLLSQDEIEDNLASQVSVDGKDWYKFVFYKKDLGGQIGVVEDSNYKLLEGLSVYSFSRYPDDNSICILELGNGYGYEFFAAIPTADN